MDEVAVLYSGGSDSTCTAVLAARAHPRVHLLTCMRLGMVHVERSNTNFRKLQEMFGPDRFRRPDLMPVDRLFRHLSYHGYLGDLRRHGLMVLTTCGVCKLAMHSRALLYCRAQGIRKVWDGANRNMYIFPEQMLSVLDLLRDLYARHGITYENPVFDYEDPQGLNFGSRVFGLNPARRETAEKAMQSTGEVLRSIGILPAADVKGTAVDRAMQARCYQFVLFNLYARWWALERESYESYAARVYRYYVDKVAVCQDLLACLEPTGGRPDARLARLLE